MEAGKPLLEANQEQDALKFLAKLPAGDGAGHEDPHYLLGTMYYSMGRNEDAKRVLKIARSEAPNQRASRPTSEWCSFLPETSRQQKFHFSPR